jgi:putative tricarboxylic transport membrane protein
VISVAGRARGDTAVGVGVVLLGLLVGWQTTLIPISAIYATIGPRAFPWVVAAALVVLGGLLVREGLRGGWAHEEGDEPINRRAVLWLGLGLVLNVALIDWVGFIVSSTLMFTCVARAFESDRPVRDLTIGFLLSVASYVGFERLLGISIGAGIFKGLI